MRGVLEDFPRATIVGSHGGGGICEVIGRLDYAYELQDEAFFLGSYAPMKIKHPPSHYLRKMYFDTAQSTNPVAMRALRTVVPVSQIVYGTDYWYRNAAETSRGLMADKVFTADELRAINRTNAERILPRYKT